MLRRSVRARVRVGAASRRRIQDGGPRATGRPAATLEEWAAIRRLVFRRARWRCQACGRWGALEVHHVVKRAQGGSDFDLDRLVALCPPCHAQTDAPYARGRLVITPLGFTVEVTQGAGKWAIRAEPRAVAAGRRTLGFTITPGCRLAVGSDATTHHRFFEDCGGGLLAVTTPLLASHLSESLPTKHSTSSRSRLPLSLSRGGAAPLRRLFNAANLSTLSTRRDCASIPVCRAPECHR